MRDGVLIGIDAGTSVIKSVAFATDGTQLASAAVPNSYVTLPNGGAEQDMTRTWADAALTLKLLSEKIPNLASRLIAISVTGQGDGMWLIDKAGEPVAPAWLWLDARAADIVEEFTTSEHYAPHYERTGTGVNVCQMSVQMAWMQRHRPEVLAKATHAFHCQDWIYFKLTGGLLHGYKEPYDDKIPMNGLGVAPAIVPAFGFKYKRVLTEIQILGTAALTWTVGFNFGHKSD
jgi:erythritol kinase